MYPNVPFLIRFKETKGYVSIEAEHFTRAVSEGKTTWSIIPGFGKTLSGITTLPVTLTPEKMYLEYDIEMEKTGNVRVELLLCSYPELQRKQRIELCSQL